MKIHKKVMVFLPNLVQRYFDLNKKINIFQEISLKGKANRVKVDFLDGFGKKYTSYSLKRWER